MKVLGLDLGVSSIGWSVIEIKDNREEISLLGLGSRIIQFNGDSDANDFIKGKGETPASKRTTARGMRRNLDRWQLHREQLTNLLSSLGILNPDETPTPLNPEQIWKLRADAASSGCKLSLRDLARVLLHINHRRGYKHAKSDMGDSKSTAYVERINALNKEINSLNLTPGQYFYKKLMESRSISEKGKSHFTFRIKEKILPRVAYENEVKKILETQKEFYPEVLTDKAINDIIQVIFYQRPLKSCKHLVSYCEFEQKMFPNSRGIMVNGGPKVTPRTSPLAQVCRIYEAINNITLTNSRLKDKEENETIESLASRSKAARKLRYKYELNDEERKAIFDYLNTNKNLTISELYKLLGLKGSGYSCDSAIRKGIKGNLTRYKIAEALKGLDEDRIEELLRFDIPIETVVDPATGEVIQVVSASVNKQPLYSLWHTLYSISDREELFKVLESKFGITDTEMLNRLYSLDFVKDGYANKSSKFIRRLLPKLMEGMQYSEACKAIDVNHSGYLTKEENKAKILNERLTPIQKGELRQPIVERVLNQMVNLVNNLLDNYGEIDEVRVELARELKKSKDERASMTEAINRQERENKTIEGEIEDLNIRSTRRRIQKMRMLKETGNICMYCGKPVSPTEFIEGHGYEVEHIIPRVRYFDDSFSNKVCACHECNAAKGAFTAYDFMSMQSEQRFNEYKDRISSLLDQGKISRTKYKYLMMKSSEIPDDFINRDLRESQYIAKKAKELLSSVIRNVYSSSGSVTDFFRHAWGYDTILHDLNFNRYEAAGLTEMQEYQTNGQVHKEVRIKNWTKRKDHRHHALDALVIALTRQGYIQRLNTLNAGYESAASKDVQKQSLSKWAAEQPHIPRQSVLEFVDNIAVSFKPGKKLATPGRTYKDSEGIVRKTLVPRGALHKETIYGKIKIYDGYKKLKYALSNLDLIADESLKKELSDRFAENHHDVAKTLKSLKTRPIIRNAQPVPEIPCFREEIVVKYPITSIRKKDIPSIVDKGIRKVIEERFKNVGSDKEFAKSVAENPIFSDREQSNEIKSVRCYTGINPASLAIVRHDSEGRAIGYAMTRNNHHVAFYTNKDGKVEDIISSFWVCIKRKKYGIPIIITNPQEAWDILAEAEDSDDVREIAAGLPPYDSQFLFSLQRNEMVVLGMSDDEWVDAVAANDIRKITKHLYRVWKMSDGEWNFKLHTNTIAAIEDGDAEMRQHYRCTSYNSLKELHPRKVVVDMLGNISLPE